MQPLMHGLFALLAFFLALYSMPSYAQAATNKDFRKFQQTLHTFQVQDKENVASISEL
jgi:hypothetical protein